MPKSVSKRFLTGCERYSVGSRGRDPLVIWASSSPSLLNLTYHEGGRRDGAVMEHGLKKKKKKRN